MAAESYTPLQLPCTECKLTFNTLYSYNRHIYGGYYGGRISNKCSCKYEHLEQLVDLQETAIARIDEKYPDTLMIELGQICVFGNERTNNTIVLIDENDTCLTGTLMLYDDSMRDKPIISIKPNDEYLAMYLFEQLSQQQNAIYYICKNTDMVDLNRIKKMKITVMSITEQQEYINNCSKLHDAFNLIIHGEM